MLISAALDRVGHLSRGVIEARVVVRVGAGLPAARQEGLWITRLAHGLYLKAPESSAAMLTARSLVTGGCLDSNEAVVVDPGRAQQHPCPEAMRIPSECEPQDVTTSSPVCALVTRSLSPAGGGDPSVLATDLIRQDHHGSRGPTVGPDLSDTRQAHTATWSTDGVAGRASDELHSRCVPARMRRVASTADAIGLAASRMPAMGTRPCGSWCCGWQAGSTLASLRTSTSCGKRTASCASSSGGWLRFTDDQRRRLAAKGPDRRSFVSRILTAKFTAS